MLRNDSTNKWIRSVIVVLTLLTFFTSGACQQAAEKNNNGRTSMVGLGAYPKVSKPALDMLHYLTEDDLWNAVEQHAKQKGMHFGLMEEFKVRVRIKLLEQGSHTIGIAARSQNYDNSTIRIYPQYPNVAYVAWKYKENPDGTRQRYATNVISPDNKKIQPYLDQGKVPPGWQVKSYSEDAIDPYDFLGLENPFDNK